MKVLLISLFHPELVRGGAQQVAYELFLGLRARPDIEPYLLSSIDQSLPALYKSGARITGFDGRENEFLFLSREYDYFWHRSSSAALLESFCEFLLLIKPDVVHFHHFLTFGVDLLTLTRRILPDARIIFTLHEFLAICAADGHMLRTSDKSLCTKASPVRCHQCFPNTRPEEFFLKEMWIKRHFDAVDMFTTPSQFMIKHYTDWGIEPERIRRVTNGQENYSGGTVLPAATKKRNRFGFFGQMVDIKGIHIIIRAVEYLRSQGFTDFVLEINGANLRYASEARRKEIEDYLEAEGQKPLGEQIVLFNGSYTSDQLRERMSRVDWCIVPSVWWEIFALVISEAWMFGRPVIASNVGGPAERIRDDVDGLHFQVGDPVSLAHAMQRACTEEGMWDRLRGNIRPPPSREVMVEGFCEVYGQKTAASADTALAAPALTSRRRRAAL